MNRERLYNLSLDRLRGEHLDALHGPLSTWISAPINGPLGPERDNGSRCLRTALTKVKYGNDL